MSRDRNVRERIDRLQSLLPKSIPSIPDVNLRVLSALNVTCNYLVARQLPSVPPPNIVFSHGDRSRLQLVPWGRVYRVNMIRHQHQRAVAAIANVPKITVEYANLILEDDEPRLHTIGDVYAKWRSEKMTPQLVFYNRDRPPNMPAVRGHASDRQRTLLAELPDDWSRMSFDSQGVLVMDLDTRNVPGYEIVRSHALAAYLKQFIDQPGTVANGSFEVRHPTMPEFKVIVGWYGEVRAREGGPPGWELTELTVITIIPDDSLSYVGSQVAKDHPTDRPVDGTNTWLGMASPGVEYEIDGVKFVDVNDRDNVMRLGGHSVDRTKSLRATTLGADLVTNTYNVMITMLAGVLNMTNDDVSQVLHDEVLAIFVRDGWALTNLTDEDIQDQLSTIALSIFFAVCTQDRLIPLTWVSRRVGTNSLVPPPIGPFVVFLPANANLALVFKHNQEVRNRMLKALGFKDPSDAFRRLDYEGYVPVDPYGMGESRAEVCCFRALSDAIEATDVYHETAKFRFHDDPFVCIRAVDMMLVVFRGSTPGSRQIFQSHFRISNLLRERDLNSIDVAEYSDLMAQDGYGAAISRSPETLINY